MSSSATCRFVERYAPSLITSHTLQSMATIAHAPLTVTPPPQGAMMALVLVIMLVAITYRVGANKLVAMLSAGKSGDVEAGGGGGGCCKSSPRIHELNMRMIILTSSRISNCCTIGVISAFVNVIHGPVLPMTNPFSPLQIIGLVSLFTNVDIGLFFILCYVRYGMRKQLGIEFKVAPGDYSKRNSSEASSSSSTVSSATVTTVANLTATTTTSMAAENNTETEVVDISSKGP